MLQRIQTVFLVIAAAIAFAAIALPMATYTRGSDQAEVVLRPMGLFTGEGAELSDVEPKVPFMAVFAVLGCALLASVFLFRHRTRQRRVVRGTFLVALGAIAFAVITDRSIQVYLGQEAPVSVSYGPSFYAPLLVLVFAYLADRAIRKDEDLVRSADRLR
ncbi:MAG: DUF4293 domain-containing protein [Flavobacteriales bacterium]|nr:DUF4293 domain-containing protein [Flavobacteriales bacterium]